MSDWKIIVPEETTNEIINPSFEVNVTDGWTNNGMVVFARSTTRARFGVASIRLVANAVADEAVGDTVANADAGETWTASCWVWIVAGDFRLRIQENAGGWTNQASVTTALIGQWVYLEVTTTLDGGVTDARVILQPASVAASEFFVDAVQFEQQDEATTYCDGEQPGCEWTGAAHNSVSDRSGVSRAGGLVQDLQVDFNLDIGAMIATGMPPLDLAVDQYAILPGGQLNSIKVLSSQPTLTGVIRGTPEPTSLLQLHARRQELINVLKSDAVPETEAGSQPVVLRYTGAAIDKEISAHYMAGLEMNIEAGIPCWEQNVAIRFVAPDPFWREVGESAQVLVTNDTTANLRYMGGRLRATGQWDDLGVAAPVVGGTVYDVLVASDQSIYIVGAFQGWNNVVGRDYIARYVPSTGAWETIGPGATFNAQIVTITEGPDGDIYVGGLFTDPGVGTMDHVARWDGAAWNAMGNPLGGGAVINTVQKLFFGSNGILYIGGAFTNWSGIGAADLVVSWNGAAYAAVGVPGIVATDVSAFAEDSQGNIYMGGNFINWAGIGDADMIVVWDGAAYSALGPPLNGQVEALVFDSGELLYVGGAFTDAGGDTDADYIAIWNGSAYSAVGNSQLNAGLQEIEIAPDGMVYIGGQFTGAGGLSLADRVAKWNGSSWAHLDVDLPGAPIVYGMDIGPADPVVNQNYDVWIGFSTTGAGFFSGIATAINDGTRAVFPRIVISRTGGTSATLKQVRNETTGKELLSDYSLLDGETLTIDLRSTRKSIVSNFFGARPDAILSGSDFGEWALLPGANQVTCFVDVAGVPTIFAYLLWEDTFWSCD